MNELWAIEKRIYTFTQTGVEFDKFAMSRFAKYRSCPVEQIIKYDFENLAGTSHDNRIEAYQNSSKQNDYCEQQITRFFLEKWKVFICNFVVSYGHLMFLSIAYVLLDKMYLLSFIYKVCQKQRIKVNKLLGGFNRGIVLPINFYIRSTKINPDVTENVIIEIKQKGNITCVK